MSCYIEIIKIITSIAKIKAEVRVELCFGLVNYRVVKILLMNLALTIA